MIFSKAMAKTILLTGATGFIGSHLLEELLTVHHKVVILKRSTSDTSRIRRSLSKVKTYNLDKGGMEKAFRENKVDLVINLVTDYGRRKDVRLSEIAGTNIVFALELAQAATRYNVPAYMNIDTALDPDVNFYAYSKSVLKTILQKFFSDRMKIFNLRLEYVYGEKDDTSKFIPFAISKLKNNEPLEMTGGKQKLDFIYIKDCVSAIAYIVKNDKKFKGRWVPLEIGTGRVMMLKSFINRIKTNLRSSSPITFGAVPYRPNEQMFSRADLSPLRGWKARYPVEKIDFNAF